MNYSPPITTIILFFFFSHSHHQKKTFLENKRVKKVTDSDFHDCHRSMKMFSLATPVTALISVPRRQIVFKTISHPLRAAGSFITPVSSSRGQHLVLQNTAMSICAGPSDSRKINLTWEWSPLGDQVVSAAVDLPDWMSGLVRQWHTSGLRETDIRAVHPGLCLGKWIRNGNSMRAVSQRHFCQGETTTVDLSPENKICRSLRFVVFRPDELRW